jgi:hypothetical protein
MLRSTALVLVCALLLGSGRLLACNWDCIDDAAAPVTACHEEPADPAGTTMGGVAHECPPEPSEPAFTAALRGGDDAVHAVQAPGLATSLVAPPAPVLFTPFERRAPVSHSRPITILRI